MKLAVAFILSLLLAVTSFGQSPDQWRGMILDEATQEDAIAIMGKPKSEKKSDKMMSYRNKTVRDLKDLRILHWENTQGFEDVKLYFVDGTLAIIQLEKPNDKIPAKVFAEAYPDVEFEIARSANSSAFYQMETVTPKSKITAGIANSTGSVMRGLFGGIGQAGNISKLEGNVMLIFIQSRRMDDKRGVDALK